MNAAPPNSVFLKPRHGVPVRIDDTRLPSLPASVAYLDIKIGVLRIANLFVRKLGITVGAFS